tara:strand:+ start:361 stop:759 length:399 start_codon:yes stop_codon:yes gene_type:complete
MRFRKDGLTANARPCINCLKMMKDIGINKVYYSTGCDTGIICESVKDMVSIQVTSVTRMFHYINNPTDQDKNIYFENLIKKLFPKEIKENNLRYFIEYNFKNIFPEYNFNIINNQIIFYKKNNEILISAFII